MQKDEEEEDPWKNKNPKLKAVNKRDSVSCLQMKFPNASQDYWSYEFNELII